jgi:GT2 family glycosyltransferase
VIVVDSAADDRVATVTRDFPEVRLLRAREEPLSAGAARNRGVREALGTLISFIDADCVPGQDWVARCRAAMTDPAVRLAGGPVEDLHPERWIAVADNRLQFAHLVDTRKERFALHFPACNMVLRREDFVAIGGFPDFTAGEDIVLCNAMVARWPGGLRFDPGMRVRHAGRATWGSYLLHQEQFGYARAAAKLHLEAWHLKWGRWRPMIPLIAAKRLSNLVSAGFHHGGVGKTLLLAPLLIPGLWRYAAGFVRGCRAAAS